jgi:transcriptional regulator with XRE-family HTH domain
MAQRIDPIIGRRLAAIRAHRMMSQTELGAAIGIGKNAIWHYETGRVEISPGRLESLAEALHCRVSDLLAPLDAPLPKIRFRQRATPQTALTPPAQLADIFVNASYRSTSDSTG